MGYACMLVLLLTRLLFVCYVAGDVVRLHPAELIPKVKVFGQGECFGADKPCEIRGSSSHEQGSLSTDNRLCNPLASIE
jgi:hypothetical protein